MGKSTDPEIRAAQSRRYALKWRYGITPEDYDELLDKQGGRCALCRSEDPQRKHGFVVDHCHDSHKVRGLLCHPCNIKLGGFFSTAEGLRLAADYVEAGGFHYD